MPEDSKKGADSGDDHDIYNIEAAEILASEAQAKYWKQYVEAYMALNNDEATKQIFSRCLLNCLQISLWQCYIRFIRKSNEKKGAEGLEETKKAFDFMLSYVGTDIASGPAKGLLSEWQPKVNSARAVYRELKKYVDEIDWNMLAIPPTGSCKEEQQWMAWKRYLAFEKANTQRIESAFANRRITFTYEQCLMYLYHYPDIWYDYATWHAKNGSLDSAAKIFQRALKALPDSDLLKYAFAELEETRGAIQPAKKVYETLVGSDNTATSLAHIQFIRFLRRTEGVEAARKYFLEARKAPSCTYHVFVAYAKMAFCLDKDSKVAHNVFEAGFKRFMHEPGYILEYADFLCRLNDDRNVRALFERALSLLPPEESEEIWKRFAQFEKAYGDLSSMLKVEERRKEALSRTTSDDGSSLTECTLHDVISRYSFMDLWPCSSKDLDHLSRQEWLAKNNKKKVDRSTLINGTSALDKGSSELLNTKAGLSSSKVIYPDTSRMIIYDPRQTNDVTAPEVPAISNPSNSAAGLALVSCGNTKAVEEILKSMSPALAAFVTNLPAVEGPTPDVDLVLSILLQSNIPTGQVGKPGSTQQAAAGTAPSTSDLSGSSRSRLNPNGSLHRPQSGKRKDLNRQEDDETSTIQSRPLPRDVFRMRQIQRARGVSNSQTGSAASGGSAFSGDQSVSTD
ncbi:uncharacterized protein A4U43_UnF2920 [Asparagus officinalis]|uniref:Suppressor of forked domain-containing protein n=1 Tax=Asparagus officinalis TaxID=4686 RepID=A0A1R3L764_ASPOF|nr:uncharacterized protein A4U43_UnF2920 [Asparagus officinalis]